MNKFTHLDVLDIRCDLDIMGRQGVLPNFSGYTLKKFIRYLVSVPDFSLNTNVKEEWLFDIWTNFVNGKNGRKDLTIESCQGQDTLHYLLMSRTEGLLLIFPPRTPGDELPPLIRFFSKVGGSIRSLISTGDTVFLRENGEVSEIDEWLFDILHLCPFMEELKLECPITISKSDPELKHKSIKKLTIVEIVGLEFTYTLKYLSLSLPNIQQLFLYFSHIDETEDTSTITIDLPLIYLDLLEWTDDVYETIPFRGPEVYFKLRTDTGLRFYLNANNNLFIIDQERYDSASSKHLRFDITCKQLKRFRMKMYNLHESNSNLFFTSVFA